MFNIAIEQYPNKYVFISHNNPSLNPMEIIGKTAAKFKYDKFIDPDIFVSHLLMNIGRLDSKKSPSFYLGISTIMNANVSFITAVSIPKGAAGFFHENGTSVENRVYSLTDLGAVYDSGIRAPPVPRQEMLESKEPPAAFRFDYAVHRLI